MRSDRKQVNLQQGQKNNGICTLLKIKKLELEHGVHKQRVNEWPACAVTMTSRRPRQAKLNFMRKMEEIFKTKTRNSQPRSQHNTRETRMAKEKGNKLTKNVNMQSEHHDKMEKQDLNIAKTNSINITVRTLRKRVQNTRNSALKQIKPSELKEYSVYDKLDENDDSTEMKLRKTARQEENPDNIMASENKENAAAKNRKTGEIDDKMEKDRKKKETEEEEGSSLKECENHIIQSAEMRKTRQKVVQKSAVNEKAVPKTKGSISHERKLCIRCRKWYANIYHHLQQIHQMESCIDALIAEKRVIQRLKDNLVLETEKMEQMLIYNEIPIQYATNIAALLQNLGHIIKNE